MQMFENMEGMTNYTKYEQKKKNKYCESMNFYFKCSMICKSKLIILYGEKFRKF